MKRERCKDLVGKFVVLVQELHLRSGAIYKPGERFRVSTTWRGRYTIVKVDGAGKDILNDGGWVAHWARNIHRYYFDVEES